MTITPYELGRRSLQRFLPPIYAQVRNCLLREVGKRPRGTLRILDVGGRKSPYTIGVPGQVTIIDLPRSTDVQEQLKLGITSQIESHLKSRRSNIEKLIIGDMTRSGLPSALFDVVVSVEVIEHVEEDDLFVSEISRVLTPGGVAILTTPNGDFVENHNLDHKRHYKRAELHLLLQRHFSDVTTEYAIAGGKYRRLGLKSWSVRKPTQTVLSAFANIINSVQSSRPGLGASANGTHHLIAIAKK